MERPRPGQAQAHRLDPETSWGIFPLRAASLGLTGMASDFIM
jgi:hypothetical protein